LAAFSSGYAAFDARDFRLKGQEQPMATAVTGSTFDQEVLRSDEPVLVDFWAEWCGPCHAVSPILDRIAGERGLKLVKVNIDEEQELSIRYGIQSIPAMILFKDGEPAAATIGARPKGQIEQMLQLDELVGPATGSNGSA
jgi:thioredoxin